MAESQNADLPLSGKWYVIHDNGNSNCVKECDEAEASNCGGKAADYKELYESFTQCCQTHTWWEIDCSAYNDDGNGGVAQLYSGKWYVEYTTADHNCVKECVDPDDADCGGPAEEYQELYDSFEECCKYHLWWIPDSPCPVA